MPIDTTQPAPEIAPLPILGGGDISGGRVLNPDQFPAEGGEQPVFRPHAFALTHGDGGAKIAYGELHYGVTIQTVTLTEIDGEQVVKSITQNPIEETKVCVPEYNSVELDPEVPNIYTQLSGYGDIFLYWEYDLGAGGAITVCEVRVGRPVEEDITFLDEDLTRTADSNGECDGKFAIQIGTVNVGSPIIQKVSSDVPWFAHVIQDDGT